MKRSILCLFLVLSLVCPSLVSCNKEPISTVATTTGEILGPVILTDDEAIQRYSERIRNGYYDGEKLYSYPDLSVFVELPAYRGLQYPDDPDVATTVTEEFLTDYITHVLIANFVSDDGYTEITDGAAQKYDVVTVDYKGYVDGVFMENATASDQSVLIGSHSYIRGFEESIIGAKVGETRSAEMVFSPYYGGDEVAGKPVRFEITVKKIQRPAIPELKLSDVNTIFGTSFQTLEEFREELLKAKNAEKESYAVDCINKYLRALLINTATFKELPQKEMEHYIGHYVDYYTQYLPEGSSMEEYCQNYLGVSYEQFLDDAKAYAEDSVKSDLIFFSIAKAENVDYTEEQLRAILVGYYNESQGIYSSMEAFIDDYVKIYGSHYFVNQLIRSSVAELIYHAAVKA